MAGLLDAFAQYIRDAMPGGVLNSELNQSNANRVINDAQRGLLESSGINARDKRRAWNKGLLDAVSGSDDTMSSINQKAFDSVMNLASIAPMGITAWHGSPHKFDKFDLSKIGTGEGAQAYGHGLYMAESPGVAKAYTTAGLLKDGDDSGWVNLIARYIPQMDEAMKDSALWKYREDKTPELSIALQHVLGGKVAPEFLNDKTVKKAIAILEKDPPTSMYKVDIPDEAVARMLDWDKPLSQQSPEVQKAVGANILFPDSMTGKEVYEAIASESVKKQGAGADHNAYASKFFRESLGLPGIRYLDQGSRGAGGGTSNYVLFSDQIPRIIERNGIETGAKPWAPGEWESFNQGLQK